ncbi:alpha-hydroxy acid oxidase [Aeromicrobium sp.]|uniref:alpha-hydroxy acid oxidase n=1 Tax=Aeromicrobium sp. TaxID=1871063 RepID=UPI0025C57C25|nr:alpha-hydroxy acid oxidase [Aeromicrobium sp.]MCK5892592.1 alpha-hydroxy-acid oxidizing protein [Aeromicrobium sp.]
MTPPVTLEDLRRRSRRRLPRFVFDFVDGAAGDEVSMVDNQEAFRRLRIQPRQQVDVSARSTRTTVLGEELTSPVMLAPTGLQRLVHRHADLEAARAASRFGTTYVVSSASAFSVEELAAVSDRPLWFQLYLWRDRRAVEHVVRRARDAGYSTLVVTVDVPIVGTRDRDLRNGMSLPPRITARNVFEGARHPRWALDLVSGPPITFKNFAEFAPQSRGMALMKYANEELTNPASGWDDLRWLRELWPGPLVVKGVMSAHDAELAVAAGADGVIVSNHGGRQLDGVPATIDVLPEVVTAIGDRAVVMLDGGVRRGTDVLKALALGARAVFVGRPYWWGLTCRGEAGVTQVLEILRSELDSAMALSGRPTIADVGADLVWRPPPTP